MTKHIVKYCILDLLKDRTRILVSENRALFYHSNQILHVEGGDVSTSDYALGSMESDHFEIDSLSSSEELQTPINFELNSDENLSTEKSLYDV